MLVLTRKVGEEIVIGENIRVSVVSLQGGKVRLGIVAPKDVIVDRKEVHDDRSRTPSERPAAQAVGSSALDIQPLFSDKPRLIALMKSSQD